MLAAITEVVTKYVIQRRLKCENDLVFKALLIVAGSRQ